MGSTSNVTMGANGTSYTQAPVERSSIPSRTPSFNASVFAGASSIMQGFGAFGNAISQGNAARIQGEYQRQQYEFNQQLSTIQAANAEYEGDVAASDEQKQVTELIGRQESAYAASGVDVTKGSAAMTTAKTKTQGIVNAINIRNNAYRTALGYKIQAVSQGTQGGLAGIAAEATAGQSLLTGTLSLAAGGIQSAYYLGGGSGNISRSGSGNFAWAGGAS